MITKILDSAILELFKSESFRLTEFQLGREPMRIIIKEMQEINASPNCEVINVSEYRGVPIRKHESDDAVIYCIAPRNWKSPQ